MTKLAFVVITLVPEAVNQSDKQIEEEISKEIRMPWLAKVEKATVLDAAT